MLTVRKVTFTILLLALVALLCMLVYRAFFYPRGEESINGARFVCGEAIDAR